MIANPQTGAIIGGNKDFTLSLKALMESKEANKNVRSRNTNNAGDRAKAKALDKFEGNNPYYMRYDIEQRKYELRYTANPDPFVPMKEGELRTNPGVPMMSDEDFEEAIKAVGRETRENQLNGRPVEYEKIWKLMEDYTAVVAPNRNEIYKTGIARTGGAMNWGFAFYDDNKAKVISYDPMNKKYSILPTPAEFARQNKATDFFNAGMREAELGIKSSTIGAKLNKKV